MYKETFPQKLKKSRVDAGYTQQQVQDETGVKRDSLSKYENGEREPNIETLGKLAQFYNVSTDWLIGVVVTPPIWVQNKRNNQDAERPRL